MPDPSCHRGPHVWLVGPFPPPVQGMALVNEDMARRLRAVGAQLVVMDTAGVSLRTDWWSRARRAGIVARALIRFARDLAVAPRGTVYLSVSGGPGQAYEAAFAAIARLRGARLFLHHHSYRYVTWKTPLASLLLWTAGRSATHVVQCEDQRDRLRARYSSAARVTVVSNAAFFHEEAGRGAKASRDAVRSIGFFGNISREKGIEEFLRASEILARRWNGGLRILIAGPPVEPGAERAVRRFLSESVQSEYRGAVYGAAKRRFFEELDVLLFPSWTESEPLTLYEALEAGVPVIALDRGCVGGILQDGVGLLVRHREQFVERAVQQVEQWRDRPEKYREASAAARRRCRVAAERARHALDRLIIDLTSG